MLLLAQAAVHAKKLYMEAVNRLVPIIEVPAMSLSNPLCDSLQLN